MNLKLRIKKDIKYTYTAYGEVTKAKASGLTIAEEELAEELMEENIILYKGYVYDNVSHLFYCNTRYYSPELCRWISPDSIDYLGPESINGLNLYCYCMNNPIMYVDHSGNFPVIIEAITTFVDGVIGFYKFTLKCSLKSLKKAPKITMNVACIVSGLCTIVLLFNTFVMIFNQGITVRKKNILIIDYFWFTKIDLADLNNGELKEIKKTKKKKLYGFFNEFYHPSTYRYNSDYVYNNGRVFKIIFYLKNDITIESYFSWMYKKNILKVNKIVNKLEKFIYICDINVMIQKNKQSENNK